MSKNCIAKRSETVNDLLSSIEFEPPRADLSTCAENGRANSRIENFDNSDVDSSIDNEFLSFREAARPMGSGEKKTAGRQKYNLKAIFSFSAKYMACFERFNSKIINTGEPSGRLEIANPESVLYDENLATKIQEWVMNECDFSISLPKSTLKYIKLFCNLPKIRSSRSKRIEPMDESEVYEPIFQISPVNYNMFRDVDRMSDSEEKTNFILRKRIDDMNSKCHNWLDTLELQ